MEQNDEWAAAIRSHFSQESMAKMYADSLSTNEATPSLSPTI